MRLIIHFEKKMSKLYRKKKEEYRAKTNAWKLYVKQ